MNRNKLGIVCLKRHGFSMIRARVECIGSRPELGRELCHGRPSTSQPIFRPLFGPEKAKAVPEELGRLEGVGEAGGDAVGGWDRVTGLGARRTGSSSRTLMLRR